MTSSIPAPLEVGPSGQWIGIDGNWSSFWVQVGTPAQSFLLLPATANNAIFVPLSEGCTNAPSSVRDCGWSRGVVSTVGPQSNGFTTNTSTTWEQLGLYELPIDQSLFGQHQNGLYGLENVELASLQAPMKDQTVVGIASADFWTGSLGLGIRDSTVSGGDVSSLLPSMKRAGLVPSLSYGYFAGAYYRDSLGGLIFGGYDESAFEPSDVVFNVDPGDSLALDLRSLVVVNALNGTVSASSDGGMRAVIDSTLPDLWLPPSACELLADALNLTLDLTTGRYLIDSSTHSALKDASPEFTFTLAANQSSSTTINIVLPYSAFDLWLLPPIYESPVPYFPIRQAPEGSDFILGRTFLQEAYIVVDWERRNFTLGQAVTEERQPKVVPLLPVEEVSPPDRSLRSGDIAAIVCSAVVAGVCILLAVLWYRRRSRKRKVTNNGLPTPSRTDEKSELPGESTIGHELESKDLTELHSSELKEMNGEEDKHQLMSEPLFELDGGYRAQELEVCTPPKQKEQR